MSAKTPIQFKGADLPYLDGVGAIEVPPLKLWMHERRLQDMKSDTYHDIPVVLMPLLAYLMLHAGRCVGYAEIFREAYLGRSERPLTLVSSQVCDLRKILRRLHLGEWIRAFPKRGYGFGKSFDPDLPLPDRWERPK